MAAPTFVGYVAADGGATAGNTYTNNFSALSLADGDLLTWTIMVEVNNSTLTTPPSGWTQRYSAGTVGSRSVMVYDKIWHTGDATSLSYVKSTGNADGNFVVAHRGVASVIYGTGQRRADQTPTSSFNNTALSITTTVADTRAIVISTEATSTAESGAFLTGPTIPSGWTQDAYKAQGTTIQTLTLAHKDMPTPGATGDAVLTYQNTQASNGWAVQMGLVPPAVQQANFVATESFTALATQGYSVAALFSASSAFTASTSSGSTASATALFSASSVFSAVVSQGMSVNAPFAANSAFSATAKKPVEVWMQNTPMFAAHRGGSASWQQHTMNAYDNAVAWNPNLALEVSVWKSADGVWVCNHDQNTGTTGTWNASYDIPTTNWSTLSTVRSTVGNYPMIRLTDLLDKYGNSRIFFIDDKPNVDQTGFLNLLDSYAGNARYIIKCYYDNSSMATAAHARGYKTWGYYYNADVVNAPSTNANWDILGLEIAGTTANWNTLKSYGRPVLAHIVQNTTQYATASAQNPAGYMVADVINVVPQGGSLADFTAVANFSATVKQGYSISAPFSASAAFNNSVVQGYSVSAPFAAGETFTVILTQGLSANAPFGATAALNAVIVPGYSVAAPFTAGATFGANTGNSASVNAPFTVASAFTNSVVQNVNVIAGFGVNANLTATVQQSGSGFIVSVWDGTTQIPVNIIGIWNGTDIVPVNILGVVSG